MKKIGKIIGFGMLAFVLLGIIGMFIPGDANNNDKVKPTAVETKEEAAEENKEKTEKVEADVSEAKESINSEVVEKVEEEESANNEVVGSNSLDALLPGDKDYNKYIHLGDSLISQDGTVSFDIIDIDYKVIEVGDLVTTQVYIVFDITNNDTSSFYIDQSVALLFIDDYEVSKGVNIDMFEQNGYYMCNGNISYPTYANIQPGGRKGMIVFMADVNNRQVTETSRIEFQINGVSFRINPLFILEQGTEDEVSDRFAGTELEGLTTVEVHEGVYLCSDSDAVITIKKDADEGMLVSAQFTNGYDFENRVIFSSSPDDNGYVNYYVMYDDDTLMTMTFIGENGLSVEGLIGGWYDKIE